MGNSQKYVKRFARSKVGDLINILLLILVALFMSFPLIFTINNAFKPLNELFVMPPQLFVNNPTLSNFIDFGIIMRESWIPLSRYFFNSVFLTIIGIVGQIVLSSLAAFAISKYSFYGKKILLSIVVLSLMFSPAVLSVPNFLVISKLGLINTPWSYILPSVCAPLGLFLMKQFIDQMVPMPLIEAAKIDGAGDFRIFFKIAMPICKPAWMTLMIFSFQTLWSSNGGIYVFDEQLKTLPFALSNISANGSISRAGVAGAISLIVMIPPIVLFLFSQNRVLQTMSTSGLKD